MMYVLVAAGLVALLLGGDFLVRGAVGLAERLDVSPMVIGFTVVALGTSAPELVVSVDAALSGVPSIAIGNVVGSNIANVLLVLGVPALVFPVVCDQHGARRDGALMLGASCLFAALCLDRELVSWQGTLMLALLATLLAYSFLNARRSGNRADDYGLEFEGVEATPHRLWLALTFIAGGCAGLLLGANWLVEGAVAVARAAGVSDAVIGLTLIAIGTSLPELATSVVAAVRHHGAVALGNVLGSNIFNALGIMGVTALVAPLPVPPQFLRFDLWVMLAAALILGLFIMRRAAIGRLTGVVFIVAYAAYVVAQFYGLSGLSASGG